MNIEDTNEFDLMEGDLLKIYNEETSDTIYNTLDINDNIPRDNIALGNNLMEGLGVTEGDFIDVSGYTGTINEITEVIIDYDSQDYNYKTLKFDDNFRVRMINFLNTYYLNSITHLYWPEENASLSILLPNIENLSPPFKISTYHDKIKLKIKPKSTGIPFNALLLIDCSGSMKKQDIKFMGMENAIDNLIRLYDGENISHTNLKDWLGHLKPKFVLDKKNYKISRIEATFVAILMFFSQKISRGLGEKCGIILYSGRSKSYTYGNKKGIFDSTDFTNIDIINDLKANLFNPLDISIDQTLFSPAIEEIKSKIKEFAQLSYNPILILFLTDGRPEPKKKDPIDKIQNKVKELMKLAESMNKQIAIFTLGIGQEDQVDGNLLTSISTIGRGEYHFTKTFIELTEWFENLANEFSISLKT